MNNYLDLNKRLNATEKNFKDSWEIITGKFTAVKNGTSTELPTLEEIAKSKKAWNELMDVSQTLNNLHLY